MKIRRIRTLKVRLIISIFVIIISIYSLLSLFFLLAYHGGIFNSSDVYNTGPHGILIIILIFFIVSVLTGIVVFYRFNNMFIKPLYQLSEAFKEVELGNYNAVVSTDVKIPELSRLLNGFNQMTKEISSVELLKKDFISSFSHEFKTPITSIRGFSRQIKEQDLTESKQREYIDIIYTESNRLINLSSNVLTLTKLEHQTYLTNVQNFNLGEQLRQTLVLLEKDWSLKQINLNLEIEDVIIKCNEEMMKQVWINIISNAINYSTPYSLLTVTCDYDGDFALVVVKDTGEGMPVDVKDRIFEKFFQGDCSHYTDGFGLGMSIVKRIVDLAHGNIKVSSKIGVGTSVEVRIPLIKGVV